MWAGGGLADFYQGRSNVGGTSEMGWCGITGIGKEVLALSPHATQRREPAAPSIWLVRFLMHPLTLTCRQKGSRSVGMQLQAGKNWLRDVSKGPWL